MRLTFYSCLLIFVLTVILLVTGSSALGWTILEDPYIPLGNVLTWLAVIALPTSLYLGIKHFRSPMTKLDKIYKAIVIVSIMLGVLWYPVTWYLADNFSGSFGGNGVFRGSARAGEYFWYYTYAIIGLPLLLLLSYFLFRLHGKFRK